MVFSKVISSEPLACTCQKEQSVFHLSEPSAALTKLLGDGQTVIRDHWVLLDPQIHEIHKIHKIHEIHKIHKIHRIHRTRFAY